METRNESFSADRNDIEIFSPEERSEINKRIETASARDSLTPPGIPTKQQASKRSLFPLFVNAGAFVLLAAGLLLLFIFQQSDAAEIRESGTVLGITERALIHEIRKEINLRLNEKESAIEEMNKRIAEVDNELRKLNSLEALTDEQYTAMEKLKREQEEYQENLARLHQDKTRILTEARSREAEARLRNDRLPEHQGIPAELSSGNRAEIERAREELSKLSGEAEKTALIEKQLAGFYAVISGQIEEKQYREAAGSIAALREYLATPSIASIKAVEARYDSDMAAIKALSALLSEAQQTRAITGLQIEEPPPIPPGAGAEEALRLQVSAQAASIAEQNAAIAALDNTLEELQKNVSDLQDRNEAFSQTIAEKDRQLENLRSQNASYSTMIETLQKTISDVNEALQNRQ